VPKIEFGLNPERLTHTTKPAPKGSAVITSKVHSAVIAATVKDGKIAIKGSKVTLKPGAQPGEYELYFE